MYRDERADHDKTEKKLDSLRNQARDQAAIIADLKTKLKEFEEQEEFLDELRDELEQVDALYAEVRENHAKKEKECGDLERELVYLKGVRITSLSSLNSTH